MQVVEPKKPYDKFIKFRDNERTRQEYAACLNLFMKDRQVKEYEELLKLSTEQAEDMIIEYILFMKEKGLSKGLVTQRCAAIRKFYSSNRINLNWDFINQHKGEFKKKQKLEAYTKEQIQKLLEICDLRTRAITLICSSAGIRVGAIPDLKLKHLKRIGDIYQFTIYENEDEEYPTFCTPECANAIDNYLDYRKRSGEVITEDSHLIIKDFNPDFPHIKQGSISEKTIRNVMTKRMVKAGLRIIEHEADTSHRKKIPINHGFRMFYCSQLVNANLNPEKRWLLEGHSLKNNDNSYIKISEQELLEEYKKAIPLLTLDQTNILQDRVEEQKNVISETARKEFEHRKTVDMLLGENKKIMAELHYIKETMETAGWDIYHPISEDENQILVENLNKDKQFYVSKTVPEKWRSKDKS